MLKMIENFSNTPIILNRCCAINLYVSGQIYEILSSIPNDVFIASYVSEKVQNEYIRPKPKTIVIDDNISENSQKSYVQATQKISLVKVIEKNLLQITDLSTDEENIGFINLATIVRSDSEAFTGAIAWYRNWFMIIDDHTTHKRLKTELPNLRLATTLELIKYWVDLTKQQYAKTRSLFQKMHIHAAYEPHPAENLYKWWQQLEIIEKNKI